mgnify:CR=1 FL=1
MTRIATVILAASLAGCTSVAVPPRNLAPLDLTLTRPCSAPAKIPGRDLTEREVATLWGGDRLALKDCARRFDATVRVYQERDRRLSGSGE